MDVATLDSLKVPVVSNEARDEMAEYCALTRKLGISNPKARLEELKGFLAENGITVYPFDKVDGYLREKVKRENPKAVWCWKPVRARDVRKEVAGGAVRTPMDAMREQLDRLQDERRRMTDRGLLREVEQLEVMIGELERQSVRMRRSTRINPFDVMFGPGPWAVGLDMAVEASAPQGLFTAPVYPHAIPRPVLMTMEKIQDAFPEAQFHASDYEVPRPDPFLAVTLPETPDVFVIERWDEPGFRM